ncbi:MAG: glycosyltransferase [Pseudomonadales bacterium]|nr:glycosyltransferase [Pseudomonadales bacterium]
MIFIIDRIEGGGAEKILVRVARLYKELKSEAVIILCNYEPSERQLSELKGLGIEVRWPNLREPRTLLGKIWSLLRFFSFCFGQVRTHPSKVVLSFLERSNVVNICVCKLLGRKAVVSVRNNLISQYSSRSRLEGSIALAGIKAVYPFSGHVIALSDAIRKMLVCDLNLDANQVTTIQNPYPLASFRKLAEAPPATPELARFIEKPGKILISIGRLDHQKGHWHLLKVFPALKKRYPDLKLVILGEGPYEALYRAFINQHGYAESCFIVGGEPNPYGALARSDVFVFPSLWEGFGNALVEALAVGTPAVSADCPHGPREILGVDPKEIIAGYRVFSSGVLVEPLDPTFTLDINETEETEESSPLFRALVRVFDDSHLRQELSINGQQRVAGFDEGIIMQAWLDVLGDSY